MTSDNSGLHRFAFPVVSEWYQYHPHIRLILWILASPCESTLGRLQTRAFSDVRSTCSRTLPVAGDHRIGQSVLRTGPTEDLFEIRREFLARGGGGLSRELLDIFSREVTVTLAVRLGVLDQDLGLPL